MIFETACNAVNLLSKIFHLLLAFFPLYSLFYKPDLFPNTILFSNYVIFCLRMNRRTTFYNECVPLFSFFFFSDKISLTQFRS